MPKVAAFVGRSFHKEDEAIVTIFLRHFEQFRKLGFEFEDAEEAESRSVAEKVKRKMAEKKVFVGIFTRRFPLAKSVARSLNPNDTTWYSRFLRRKDHLVAPSGWTTQECGFAIGKDMKLILLVEQGVVDIGGLHGDHEVITFPRTDPAKCFPTLDAQIINLLAEPEKSHGQPDAESVPEKPPAAEAKSDLQQAENKQEETKQNFFLDIHVKLFGDKDPEGAKKLLDESLLTVANEEDATHRKAWFEWLRFKAGYSEGYDELERLKREYPDHPSPIQFLARLVKGLGQLSAAAEYFQDASRKESKIQKKAEFLVEASVCLSEDNKSEDANNLLENALPNFAEDSDATFELYSGLAQIAKVKKDTERQVALLEKALSIRPTEHTLRFDLALAYAALARHPLALFHYRILAQEAPDGSNLNNLAVTYMNLELPAKAVSHYKKAADLGETLAMANLSYKYIGEGFLDDASDLLEKALTFKDFHQNVASARARIDEVKNHEGKKEEEILNGIVEERRFRLSFANAITVRPEEVPNIDGKWKTPHGAVDITVVNGTLRGTGTRQEPDFSLGLADALLTTAQVAPRQITKKTVIECTLQRAGGRGEIKIFSEGKSLLTSSTQIFKVQLIISSEDEIKVLTADEKGNITLGIFQRLAKASHV